MNDINPYESSSLPPSDTSAARKSALIFVIPATLIGAFVGRWLLARFVSGPGDPGGQFMGASVGGMVGLLAGLVLNANSSSTEGTPRQESDHKIVLSGDVVRHLLPDGDREEVCLERLASFEVHTNDEGPFLPDVFWVLHDDRTQCIIPQDATGADELLDRLFQLPGFDSEQFSAAMGSTSVQTFLCWRRSGV